jgi:cardiolipin synthase
MTTVHVIFPVLRGSRRFLVEKGRRWSVVEHLLLDAVSKKPASAAELAQMSALPRRVVIEALIRLMRATWVEIHATTAGSIFKATPLGQAKAPLHQLPAATTIEPHWRSFAIDQITGGVFRGRELDLRPKSKLPVPSDEQIVIHLPGSNFSSMDLGEVFSAIEGEDESIVGVDRSHEKLIERHAIVTVRDDVIEGLPGRANPMLRLLVGSKARDAAALFKRGKGKAAAAPADAPPEVEATPAEPIEAPVSHNALYEHDDLIVDGPDHQTVFDRMIRNCTDRLIVHSTFITDARATVLLPALVHAAEKGAKVDVLWGQDDVGGGTSASQAAAARLQTAVAETGRSDSIRIHPFSTHSHAKIVISDDGRGGWRALVGSCNWLASDFSSFEASIRLRDPVLVGLLIRRLASLARGRPGLWHELALEMTFLGRRIESMPRANGRTVPMRLLFAPDHAKLPLEARDRANRRMFVLSHRLGIAGRPMALLPALAAVKARKIDASIYYGRTTGALSGVAGADLAREFAKEGVEIRPVHRPRLHAKVLGWDDDALCVSSLNWLSADPADAARDREIGVLVEAPKIAENFIRRFEHARID